MNGPSKHGPELDAAIKEAIVAGKLRPHEALVKIHAGTLDGLSGPVEIPRRTFYYRWNAMQRELANPRDQGPRLVDRLRLTMVDGWEDKSPEQLAEEMGWTPAYVSEVLDAIAKWRNGNQPARTTLGRA